MKRYTLSDTNVPMAYFYFYICVRLPLSLMNFLANMDFSSSYNFLLPLLEQLTLLCACIGLFKRKYWGYTINKIFLIVEIGLAICLLPFDIASFFTGSDYEYIGFLGMLIVNIPTFIYFEKRKYLFNGAPIQNQHNKYNIDILPEGYAIDKDGLPYKKNRVYGWGKEFNAFITANGNCYHKSKCPLIKGNKKILLHRYTAIKHYTPCQVCKPKNYIDEWFLKSVSSQPQPINSQPAKDEIYFSHTCSSCSKTFNVKYKIPVNQAFIPTLSTICPNCKSKEIIETGNKLYQKDL